MNLTHIRKTQKEIREFKFECVDLLRAEKPKIFILHQSRDTETERGKQCNELPVPV